MSKLHEILAVEKDKETVAKKLMLESIKTLGKENLFSGALRELKMFDEAESFNNITDNQELTTTVGENLDYLVNPVAEYYDVVLQKDLTNQKAIADIVIDGKTLATGLPATFLLGMEKKLAEFRKVLEAVHTLAPGIKWIDDKNNAKANVFVSNDTEKTFKTMKDIEFKTAAPATKEHPAQVMQIPVTKNVGEFETTKWSGMLTPVDKANKIARLDTLITAVKKARQRANNVEIVTGNVGTDLLTYVING